MQLISKEKIQELREELVYMDGDSWFCKTVPMLLDELDKAHSIIDKRGD